MTARLHAAVRFRKTRPSMCAAAGIGGAGSTGSPGSGSATSSLGRCYRLARRLAHAGAHPVQGEVEQAFGLLALFRPAGG